MTARQRRVPAGPHVPPTRGEAAPRPSIVVTVAVPAASAELEVAARRNGLYAEAVKRHGGEPILLDATATAGAREAAFERMDGLLLSGGADLHPSRYGEPDRGSRSVEPDRDALEFDAFAAAQARQLPVLGICRGMQALNAFLGGTLEQHVEGHVGASWRHGPAATHAIRLVPGTRLAALVGPAPGPGTQGPVGDPGLVVNSYHHQAVRRAGLAPGLVASAAAGSGDDEIVEGLELPGDRFAVGVQCHPERTESTPPAFERLWAAFVDACRGGGGPGVSAARPMLQPPASITRRRNCCVRASRGALNRAAGVPSSRIRPRRGSRRGSRRRERTPSHGWR